MDNVERVSYRPVKTARNKYLLAGTAVCVVAGLLWGLSHWIAPPTAERASESMVTLSALYLDGTKQFYSVALIGDDKSIAVCRHILTNTAALEAEDSLGNYYEITGVTAFDEHHAVLRLGRSTGLKPLSMYEGILQNSSSLSRLTEEGTTPFSVVEMEDGMVKTEDAVSCGQPILTKTGEFAGICCGESQMVSSSENILALLSGEGVLYRLEELRWKNAYTASELNALFLGGYHFEGERYTYHIAWDEPEIIITDNRTMEVRKTGLKGKNLIVSAGKLYYWGWDNYVYGAELDGSASTRVGKFETTFFQLWQDRIYYLSMEGELCSYEMESGRTTTYETDISCFFFWEDALYVLDGQGLLKKMTLNGTVLGTVWTEGMGCVTIWKKKITFWGEDGGLWCLDSETLRLQQKGEIEEPRFLFGSGNRLLAGKYTGIHEYLGGNLPQIRRGFVLYIYEKGGAIYAEEELLP